MDKAIGFELNGEQVFSVNKLDNGILIEGPDEDDQAVAIPWPLIGELADTLSLLADPGPSAKAAPSVDAEALQARIDAAVEIILGEDDPDAPGRPWLVDRVLTTLRDVSYTEARKMAAPPNKVEPRG